MKLVILKKEEEEVKIDPKAKKPDPKAKLEEKKEEEGKFKVSYEIGKEEIPVEFELQMFYQGPAFEDPNPPPVEEEVKKVAPGKGKPNPKAADIPDVPVIRMITPDPVLMTNESGRLFEIELGRNEKIKIEPTEEGQEEQFEDKYIQYQFNQTITNLVRSHFIRSYTIM